MSVSSKPFQARFLLGNTDYTKCPQDGKPEVAFIGRSNVGKSSLINAITNQKKLAKTSSTPGKTREINHFLLDEKFHLVDLPGYGFAKMSKVEKEQMGQMIDDYLINREPLMAVFVLIDIRLKAQPIDLQFITWLATNEIPLILVYTKADKLGKMKRNDNLKRYKDVLLDTWEELPPIFVTSSEDETGIADLRRYLREITSK